MKIISIAAVAAFAVTPLTAHAATPQDKETSVWQAFKDRKADTFKGMLEPGFVALYEEGTQSRDQEIQSLKNSRLQSFKISEFRHRMIDPEDVLMTYVVDVKGTMGKQDVSGRYRAASVWHRSGNGKGSLWRATFHTEVKVR